MKGNPVYCGFDQVKGYLYGNQYREKSREKRLGANAASRKSPPPGIKRIIHGVTANAKSSIAKGPSLTGLACVLLLVLFFFCQFEFVRQKFKPDLPALEIWVQV